MRSALLSIALFFVAFTSEAHPLEITVSTVPEFLAAIGSDRTIILQPGEYDLSAFAEGSGPNYVFTRSGDGNELHVRGLHNLEIRCKDKHEAHLIARPRYGNVLSFQDCNNIRLTNLKAGHGPKKGYCSGGVFVFQRCNGIALDHNLLYGSGIEGVTLDECMNFSATHTIIEECTYSIMSIYSSEAVRFENCTFRRNKEFGMVNIDKTKEVRFINCAFEENEAKENDFFELDAESRVFIQGGHFGANNCEHLTKFESNVTLKRVIFTDDNTYDQAQYEYPKD
jgi:Right handed beta helix region